MVRDEALDFSVRALLVNPALDVTHNYLIHMSNLCGLLAHIDVGFWWDSRTI